ncbi:cytotoxic T-lymphocyte protein 4 [Centroberyx gerrardi]|uniref:cytotoxic T-lymphocyte protein 4 n=1 Tax=Centroberyx gerrardi TaxID=166262 RepID=UPI003AAFE01F
MMGWSVLTVFCLCLPVWSAVKVMQPYSVVSSNGTARLQCLIRPQPAFPPRPSSTPRPRPAYPHPVPEELRVFLLKGLHDSQELCSSSINFPERRERDREEGEVQCHARLTGGAVELTVSGLKPRDTDIYRCVIEVLYPPPYLRLTGNGTLIHVMESPDCPVPGAQRQNTHQVDEDEDEDEGDGRTSAAPPVSASVIILVMLVLFVLIIIIYFQTLQFIRWRTEAGRLLPPHKMDAVKVPYGNIA